MLRTACADVARLRRSRDTAALRVSVNASAAELRDADYPARVEQACADAGLPLSALRLEITESLALDESDEVDRVLADLQALGVALSIDDFGTGYSSFSILTRVPVGRDQARPLADLAVRRPARAARCCAPSSTSARRSRVDVIAEGIETVAQLAGAARARLPVRRRDSCSGGRSRSRDRPRPAAGRRPEPGHEILEGPRTGSAGPRPPSILRCGYRVGLVTA